MGHMERGAHSEGTHCMDHADKAPNGLNIHTRTVGRWEGRVQVG